MQVRVIISVGHYYIARKTEVIVMGFTLALKALISLAVGFVFWFWAFLVFMVYSFMPISKKGNSIIFAVAAPLLYLIVTNLLIKKLFKESGWPNFLINFLITLATSVFSLIVIDSVAKIMR